MIVLNALIIFIIRETSAHTGETKTGTVYWFSEYQTERGHTLYRNIS